MVYYGFLVKECIWELIIFKNYVLGEYGYIY